jgi:hypothetical protein
MNTDKLTRNQAAALNYITGNGSMWVNQQGLGKLPAGAKSLATKGLVIVADHTDKWGNTGRAYILPAPAASDFSNCSVCGSPFTTCNH